MTDGGVKGRAKALFTGAPPGAEPSGQPEVPADAMADADAQRQALQVLTLAQRTADEHLAGAHRQADKILSDVRVPGRGGCQGSRRRMPMIFDTKPTGRWRMHTQPRSR